MSQHKGMMGMKLKRVVVVDDHSLFLDGITGLLESAGYSIIGRALEGETAIKIIQKEKPDLVLLDILMPGINGIEVLKNIKTFDPKIQVVMLTMSTIEDDFLNAISAGADGYLLKDLNTQVFLSLLKGLEQGVAAIDPKMTTILMHEYRTISVQERETETCLTEREMELISLLVAGKSNKEIAESMFISENTVKYHIRNILQKFGVQNRTEAAAYALKEGIIDL